MSVRSRRLPRWFTWWVPVEVLIALVPTIILAVAIAAVLPAEDVPRIATLQDGSTAYYCQSLCELVLPPVFMVLLIAFVPVAIRVCPPPRDVIRRYERRWQQQTPTMRKAGFGCSVIIVVVLIFAMLADIVARYVEVRTIVVTKDAVIVESLSGSWQLPRADIRRARLSYDAGAAGRKAKVSVRLDIQRRDGEWYPIVERTLWNAQPSLQNYVDFVRQLESHVNRE